MPEVHINHPRHLIELWAEEAAELDKHLSAAKEAECSEAVRATFETGANTLRRCARMLENRLLWSGL